MDIPDWLSKFEAQGIWHLIDPPNFLDIDASQIVIVMFESQFHKAWTNQGVKALKDEAPQRLKRTGWDSVRLSLSDNRSVRFFYTVPAVIQ